MERCFSTRRICQVPLSLQEIQKYEKPIHGAGVSADGRGGSSAVFAAEPLPVFVTAHYDQEAQVRSIAPRFQHLIVDRIKKTVQTEALPEELDALRRAGLRVEIDKVGTERLQRLQTALTQYNSLRSVPGYSCYRTVEETYGTMDSLVQQAPNRPRWWR
ncbi:hypothetical protein ACN28S_22235 [Cystobacter fuscus]